VEVARSELLLSCVTARLACLRCSRCWHRCKMLPVALIKAILCLSCALVRASACTCLPPAKPACLASVFALRVTMLRIVTMIRNAAAGNGSS
jgi:hypothetical protein